MKIGIIQEMDDIDGVPPPKWSGRPRLFGVIGIYSAIPYRIISPENLRELISLRYPLAIQKKGAHPFLHCDFCSGIDIS